MNNKKIALLSVLSACVLFVFSPHITAYADESLDVDTKIEENLDEMLDNIDFSDFGKYVEDLYSVTGESVGVKDKIKSLMKGETYLDFSSAAKLLYDMLLGDFKKKVPALVGVFLLMIACALIRFIKPERFGNGVYEISYFASYTAIVCIVTAIVSSAVSSAYDAMDKMGKAMESAFPLMLTLMTVTGNVNSVAVYTPASVFISDFILVIFKTVVFPTISAILALSVISNISEQIKLKSLIGFLSSALKWIIGLITAVFSIFLTVKGLNSGIYDGISVKALKYTVNSGIPIVGGTVRDGLDIIFACAGLLKNALGAFSLVVIFGIIVKPILEIAALSLALKLVGAATEPIGDGRPSAFVSSVSVSLNFSIAALITVSLCFTLTILTALLSANMVL